MIAKQDEKLLKFSIDTIDKIIEAKNKGKKIVESCENNEHLKAAKEYVNLYSERTGDYVGASELEIMILAKRMLL